MCINYKRLNLVRSTLGTFMIHKDILPKKKKIVRNSKVIGQLGKGWMITGIPISRWLGDQHSSMLA